MRNKLTKLIMKIRWNLYLKHRAWEEMRLVVKMCLEGKYPEFWSRRLDYLLSEYREIDKEINS